MTDPGYGKPLLGGGGGEQCARAAKQYFFQFSPVQLPQKIAAQGNGAAPAAGAAGVNVLLVVVEDHRSAVRQLSAQRDAVPTGKLQKHFLAQLPKVAGDDEVKILRGGLHVVKMGFNGGIGGGG
mgnify:FL=1